MAHRYGTDHHETVPHASDLPGHLRAWSGTSTTTAGGDVSPVFRLQADPRVGREALAFDLRHYLPALLQVEDRMSMAWGLESRVPLLDHRLVEAAMRIPPAIKLHE